MKGTDRYDSLIQYYSKQCDLKWWMIKKQLLAESDLRPGAISPVGARGVAQFMGPTWKEWNDPDYAPPVTSQDMEDFRTAIEQIGCLFVKPAKPEEFGFKLVEHDKNQETLYQAADVDQKTEKRVKELLTNLVDNPHNPEEGIKAMCAYMAYLYGRFREIPDGDERMKFALASYNAGRGNINKMLELAREASGAPKNYFDWQGAGRKAGKWQTWEYASQFLVKVTGDDHSRETLGYIEKIA